MKKNYDMHHIGDSFETWHFFNFRSIDASIYKVYNILIITTT